MKYALAFILVAGLFHFATATGARADNVTLLDADFSCLGAACQQQSIHEDAAPFKGSVTITVTNTGIEDWGDFHFEFFQQTAETIEDVHFVVSTPYQPTATHTSNLSWAVDNVAVGATLDLFFYDDPLAQDESTTFVIYTDNTIDSVSFFGTLYYPTPVPEPGTFLLVGAGLIGIAGFGRAANRRKARR
jgi:hypothetical protein